MTEPPDGSRGKVPAYKLDFRLDRIFPPDKPLSVPLLRLMMAANDVRHIQKLLLLALERNDELIGFDDIVLNGELLHLHRLLCSHLYEAAHAFRAIDNQQPEMANTAVKDTGYEQGLQRLRKAYTGDPPGAFHHSYLKEIRDHFGFHYKQDSIRAKLEAFLTSGGLDGTVIAAEPGGLSRYVVADHLMISMLQDILNAELPQLHPAFDKVMREVLSLAKDLADIVDLMLLPLLEQNPSAIIKKESGTLSVQAELMNAKQPVDKLNALPEGGEGPEQQAGMGEEKGGNAP